MLINLLRILLFWGHLGIILQRLRLHEQQREIPSSMTSPNETHAEFGQSVRRGDGTYPSICKNNDNIVVQVNNSVGVRNQLWYHVGKAHARGSISWGNSVCYGEGSFPRVAINNNGTVVEVHEASFQRHVYYRVGVVDADTQKIEWGDDIRYDEGLGPAVALLDDNTVICVYQTAFIGSYTTWYRVGKVYLDHKNIAWGKSVSYGRGAQLALTANENAVVEVHKGIMLANSLHYRVGKLNTKELTIVWGESARYGEGYNPSVAINSRGHVLEVHTSIALRRLYRKIGAVSVTETQTLDWAHGDPLQYDMGKYPSVCLSDDDDKNILEAHETNLGTSIWYRTGTLKPSTN